MWPGRVCRDVMGWDVLNWSQALAFWDRVLPRQLSQWQCLELGIAGGGLSLYLGLKGAHVLCTNLSEPTLQTRACHRQYGLKEIRYAAVDARALPYADQSFDVVCFKSVLGGIRKQAERDPKPHIMAEILRVLKPGGYLLLAENAAGHALHRQLRRRFVAWSAGWEYLETHEMATLLQGFESYELMSTGFLALLGRTEAQRRILGTWDRYLVPYMPEAWRYVMIAWAQKAR